MGSEMCIRDSPTTATVTVRAGALVADPDMGVLPVGDRDLSRVGGAARRLSGRLCCDGRMHAYAQTPVSPTPHDEFLWLEEIHGERPLDWVREQNARTEALLESPELREVEAGILAALDAPDRIALVTKRGDRYYNLWRDAEHPRGLWRRTDWESYLAGDPQWEVLLDLHALAERD